MPDIAGVFTDKLQDVFSGFYREDAKIDLCHAQIGTDPDNCHGYDFIIKCWAVPLKITSQFFLKEPGYFALSCCLS